MEGKSSVPGERGSVDTVEKDRWPESVGRGGYRWGVRFSHRLFPKRAGGVKILVHSRITNRNRHRAEFYSKNARRLAWFSLGKEICSCGDWMRELWRRM